MRTQKQKTMQWLVIIVVVYVLWTILKKMHFITLFVVHVPFCWLVAGILGVGFLVWWFVFRKQ